MKRKDPQKCVRDGVVSSLSNTEQSRMDLELIGVDARRPCRGLQERNGKRRVTKEMAWTRARD